MCQTLVSASLFFLILIKKIKKNYKTIFPKLEETRSQQKQISFHKKTQNLSVPLVPEVTKGQLFPCLRVFIVVLSNIFKFPVLLNRK